MVVFFGEDEDTIRKAKAAVRRALADGMPIKGYVQASARPIKTFGPYTIGSANEIVFFANVYETATIVNASKPNRDMEQFVYETLSEDYQKFIVGGFGKETDLSSEGSADSSTSSTVN